MNNNLPRFDSEQLVEGARAQREKLVRYSTREGFLEMMEHLYNFNRATKKRMGLKFEAEKAMRLRNPAFRNSEETRAAALATR